MVPALVTIRLIACSTPSRIGIRILAPAQTWVTSLGLARIPYCAINLLEGRLYGVHLKDFDAPRRDAKGCVLGEGLLNVTAVFAALKKVGFPADACLAIEYEEKPSDPVEDIKQCLDVAQESAQKAFS